MGLEVVTEEQLERLTEVAHFAQELANLTPDPQQPYVGSGAFAHKAGLHVAAITKSAGSYTHVDPLRVGNTERVLVSELSGRRNISQKLREQGANLELTDEQAARALERVKERESKGAAFESAEASFELLVRRTLEGYHAHFVLEDFLIVERRRHADENGPEARSALLAAAMVQLRTGQQLRQVAGDANGPATGTH